MIAYVGISAIALINLMFAFYFILGDGRGELSWMGYLSLLVAVILMLILLRYHRARKRNEMKDFNAHIKSDEDRLIK